MIKSKFYISGFVLFLIVVGLKCSANAALVDNGDGTITDTDSGLMWLKDANSWAPDWWDDDWIGALDWADQLTFAGYDNWRLPSAYNQDGSGPCQGYNCTDSELGNLFYNVLGGSASQPPSNTGPFINVSQYGYWTNDLYNINDAWLFDWAEGYQLHTFWGTTNVSAWAVRVVPEPVSSTLFIVGVATLGFRQWRKRKTA